MRRKGGWATAVPAPTPGQLVQRVDGQLVMTTPQSILVTQGVMIIAVEDEKSLAEHYDTKIEGEFLIVPVIKRRLEDRLGLGSCASGLSLLQAIERLAKISVGQVEIPFTTGQLEELAYRAEKNGRTLRQEVESVIKRLESELFHRAPTPAGPGSR